MCCSVGRNTGNRCRKERKTLLLFSQKRGLFYYWMEWLGRLPGKLSSPQDSLNGSDLRSLVTTVFLGSILGELLSPDSTERELFLGLAVQMCSDLVGTM